MPKIRYREINFSADKLDVIEKANEIIEEYQAEGYDLTLRQLFYQFVSRDWLPNTVRSYKRLGDIISDARLAGLVDWLAIVDRTRNLKSLATWEKPADIVDAAAKQFRVDFWATQGARVECFPPETEVQTPRGPVCIGAIRVGDVVISGSGRRRVVTRVFKRAYQGDLIEIRAAGFLPVRCTPEHPIWTRSPDPTLPGYKGADRRFRPPEYCPAVELEKNSLLRVPRLTAPMWNPTHIEFDVGRRSFDPGPIEVEFYFLHVLGFYLAEGSIRGDRRTVQFCFSRDEGEYVDLVQRWADRYQISCSQAEGNGTLIAYVFSKPFADFLLKSFGTGSRSKRLGKFLELHPISQMPLLRAYFLGDGHHRDVTRSAVTVTTFSKTLAHDVQSVLHRIGWLAAIDEAADHDTVRYRISVGGKSGVDLAEVWHLDLPPKGLGRSGRYNLLRRDEKYVYAPIRSVTRVPYDGDVYNLEVEEDHTYCVPFDVHNCWVEKEALAGVVERACNEWRVPFFSCKGYTSQSEMWSAAQRLQSYFDAGQAPVIIHLGDHDPSGIDMTRDLEDRLERFCGGVRVNRIALNFDQVEQYQPPPNPAKITDPRALVYVRRFGDESWELDALNPQTLNALISDAVRSEIDWGPWEKARDLEEEHRRDLSKVAARYDDVKKFLAKRRAA